MIAENMRHHEHIGVRLKARRDCPQNFLLIKHVDVFIHGDQELEIRIETEEKRQRLARLPVCTENLNPYGVVMESPSRAYNRMLSVR